MLQDSCKNIPSTGKSSNSSSSSNCVLGFLFDAFSGRVSSFVSLVVAFVVGAEPPCGAPDMFAMRGRYKSMRSSMPVVTLTALEMDALIGG